MQHTDQTREETWKTMVLFKSRSFYISTTKLQQNKIRPKNSNVEERRVEQYIFMSLFVKSVKIQYAITQQKVPHITRYSSSIEHII